MLAMLAGSRGKIKVALVYDLPLEGFRGSTAAVTSLSIINNAEAVASTKALFEKGLRFWVKALAGAPKFPPELTEASVSVEFSGRYCVNINRSTNKRGLSPEDFKNAAAGVAMLNSHEDWVKLRNSGTALRCSGVPQDLAAYPRYHYVLVLTNTNGNQVIGGSTGVNYWQAMSGSSADFTAEPPPGARVRSMPNGKIKVSDLIMMSIDQRYNSVEVFAHEIGHSGYMPHTKVGEADSLKDPASFDSIMDYNFESSLKNPADGSARTSDNPLVTPADRAVAREYWRMVSASDANLDPETTPIVYAGIFKMWSPWFSINNLG